MPLVAISLGRVVLPSPKIVINLPGTYEKVPCKGEPDRYRQTHILLFYYKDIGYTWIYGQGEIYHQFRLLIWTEFTGQFVHPVGGEWIG